MALTSAQLETLKKEAEKYMDANEAFGKAAVALWNASIGMAIASEDEEAILESTTQLRAHGAIWGDNCDCEVQQQ